ncbi:PREDICTED: ubiquitin carboxyl-terminal hydrolase 32-like isoform X2 [Amphimedon queenslandica]|uniref:ubiquitinyl hydrolase 1 n=1 Tax=Amphimedon queenslandica TaxID=400682 RepID=A0A1X7VHH7_AMPQE|nr:PREDICTED: ubiquitin carboxyl-terminal hydrolase 32-like isoform X2 [Amphimedon queenslandica]|eukprot:XP_019848743.1 PREDICTED: ubiquitin carboxyl-terminal hydrolase 32-like isoform X2 [Amphimedon queenslandica]
MGLGRSKFPISLDEATVRATPEVVQRLRDTYDRFSSNTGLLPQVTFLRDIFGDGMPPKLAEELYEAFRGGQKGIKFNDLLRGLVLLVQGTRQEKILFLTQMLTDEDHLITKESVQKFVALVDTDPSTEDLDTLFPEFSSCTPNYFSNWLETHPNLCSFTQWLLGDENTMSLTAEPDPPTFYQTLADKNGLTDRDVMNIEKTYWGLKGGNAKFDSSVFCKILFPPLPAGLVQSIFSYLDINKDGHIDLSEMVRGVAIFCRKPLNETLLVFFELFDEDKDGYLNEYELTAALQMLAELKRNNTVKETENEETIIDTILTEHQEKLQDSGLDRAEFVSWCSQDTGSGWSLVSVLLQVLVEVCHVKLGLRPSQPMEEASIISGYMNRFKKSGRSKGQLVYLMSTQWFNSWRIYTQFEMDDCPLSSLIPPAEQSSKNTDRGDRGTTPVAEPEIVDVTVEGEDVAEGYTHIVTPETSSSGSAQKRGGVQSHPQEDEDPLKPIGISNSHLCLEEPFPGSKKLISLTNEGGVLKPSLKEYVDYYLLPEDVWRALVTWYGTAGLGGGPPLPRPVINEEGVVSLYPTLLKVFRHTTLPPAKQSKSTGPWNSMLEVFSFFGFRSGGGADNSATPVGNTPLPGDATQPLLPRRILYYSAAFYDNNTLQEMVEVMQKVLHAKPDEVRIYSLSDDEEQLELLDEEEKTVEDLGFKNGQKILVETRNKDNSWPEELVAAIKEVQAKDSNEKQVVKSQGTKVPEGATGLSNLGNTCFMNSSLQCISNLQPLTTYFKEKDYLLEINKQNPLGMKGVMAKRYGELVSDLWTGHSKSITPWRFRYTIAQNAPQFNNFQQQDAQELLSFVLDGLHEDLNRVKVKPYRELPDSDDRPIAEVADEAWSYHRERNNSIIVDLFQGQLKSLVECTVCSYKSIKFDPFTFLSLPLPLESSTSLEIIVIPIDGSQPTRYCLKLELDAKYRLLKEQLVEMCQINRLILVDVYGGTVRSFPNDDQKMRTVLSGSLYAYEIPPHYRRITPSREEEQPLERTETNDEGEESINKGEESTSKEEAEAPTEVETTKEEIEQETKTPTEEVESSAKGAESDTPTTNKVENGEIGGSVGNGGEQKEEEKEEEEKVKEEGEGVKEEGEGVKEKEEGEVKTNDTKQSSAPPSQPRPSYCNPRDHGFIFGIHRRTLRLDNYFVSTQKNRPILFSYPMVLPCAPTTPHSALYKEIWNQVQRLIIPDPPNTDDEESLQRQSYPYKLKKVRRDGLFCCHCPWYRFCRGCPIECDEGTFGADDPPHYIAIDWEDGFIHLKYQSGLERPKDHESMDIMKNTDSQPIELSECLAAFSKPEELGEDELWYCKKCETHRPARKTLEVWKLPPVLIIHLKRFHFHNGRWIKSQQRVRFPMSGLDPYAYSDSELFNNNEFIQTGIEGEELNGEVGGDSVTPPLTGEGEESAPLGVSVEVNDERKEEEEEEEGEGEKNDKELLVVASDEDQNENELTENEIQESDEIKAGVPKLRDIKRNFSRTTSVYMSSRPIYDLFAITVHSGILGGGHYTSFAKNPNSNWYYYNDSSCKETTEDKVSSESPYMLFYEVRDLREHVDEYRVGGARSPPLSPVNDNDEGILQGEGGRGKSSGGRGKCRQQ